MIRIEASDGATCSAMEITAFMAASSAIIGRLSSDTAARTAAIISASGGRGMNSLAPARMASAAFRASGSTPQATTGARMRSASLAAMRAPMSRL